LFVGFLLIAGAENNNTPKQEKHMTHNSKNLICITKGKDLGTQPKSVKNCFSE
jgi:hypothetical protein